MLLTDLIALERPIIFFDLETTGPNPREDRIVELGFTLIKPDGSEREWNRLIDPGVPIPREATRGTPDGTFEGHGITDEMVAGATTFAALAPALLPGFVGCDFGGYNVKTFDLPLLKAEAERAGRPWDYAGARILDGYRLWQAAEKRTLSDAVARFLGRTHDGAHRTIGDVRASRDVVVEILTAFALPRDLAALHDLQWPVNPDALDPEGKIIWKDGVATMNFGKWKGTPLTRVERGYLKWLVDKADQMNDTVREICRAALAGRFPVREG